MNEEKILIEADSSHAWKIRDGLWIGSAPPVGTAIHSSGFDCVILMAKEYQPVGWYQFVDVIGAPMDDSELTVDEARQAMAVAREAIVRINSGQKVLSTCMAGLNRSGLVCGLILMFGYEMSANDAIALIRAARGPDALCNPYFVNFLRRVAP